MQKDEVSNFFTGLLVGLVVGGAIGVLFAPQPGKETRKLIREKARDMKHKIRPTVDTTIKK